MGDATLFDFAKGQQLRDLGIEIVSGFPNDTWITNARRVAVRLAQLNGTVTSDDVQKILPRPSEIHPNATGSVFRTKELRLVGFKASEKTSRHAARIGIYQAVDESCAS